VACTRSGTPSRQHLYARGVEIKLISKLSGHSSTQITYDRYVHLFECDIDDTLRQAVGT